MVFKKFRFKRFKTKNKNFRLELVQSTPASEDDSSREEMPAGTVYFASDSSSFQDFSAFQKQDFQYQQNFQMNNNQSSTEPFQEELIFSRFSRPSRLLLLSVGTRGRDR